MTDRTTIPAGQRTVEAGASGNHASCQRRAQPEVVTNARAVAKQIIGGKGCNQFELLHELGRGSHAKVLLARQVATVKGRHPRARRPSGAGSSEVAIKCIDLRSAEDGQISDQKRAAVAREVDTLLKLRHQPHCVHLLEAFCEGPQCFIVMERCELSLFKALSLKSNLTERTYAGSFLQMFRALEAIHAFDIIHLDVKPDNFMCTGAETTVKLCDFGLSTIISPHCRPRAVRGTAPYMSPEMVRGQGYDTKTDIWSLGIVMYVLVYGEFPYMPFQPCKSKRERAEAMKATIACGLPRPNFKPRKGFGVPSVSYAAEVFLREVLQRNPQARPPASSFLTHAWLTTPPAAAGAAGSCCEPSLRPMLLAALQSGAFENVKSAFDDLKLSLALPPVSKRSPAARDTVAQQPTAPAKEATSPGGAGAAEALKSLKPPPPELSDVSETSTTVESGGTGSSAYPSSPNAFRLEV